MKGYSMKTKRTLLLSLLLVAVSALASAESPKAPQPQAIDEAIDACELCKMSVKNSGYAAEIVADHGLVYKFDDIGCLLRFKEKRTELKILGEFVQSAFDKKWVDVAQASYALFPDLPTPMGYGIHAFGVKADAEAFIAAHHGAKAIGVADLNSVKPVMRKGGMKMDAGK
jgi:copper chaperone NosL